MRNVRVLGDMPDARFQRSKDIIGVIARHPHFRQQSLNTLVVPKAGISKTVVSFRHPCLEYGTKSRIPAW